MFFIDCSCFVVLVIISPSLNGFAYMCYGSVSAGDALGRERLVTPMSSYYAGRSGCKVT